MAYTWSQEDGVMNCLTSEKLKRMKKINRASDGNQLSREQDGHTGKII